MAAFIRFNKGLLKFPYPVKIWLAGLMAANMAAPLFYINRIEAQVVLATFLASFGLMIVLTAYSGFSRLLGLGHVLWFPLLWFLWVRVDLYPVDGAFGLWMRSVMVLNAVSLAIDTLDVVKYLAGDRREIVSGL